MITIVQPEAVLEQLPQPRPLVLSVLLLRQARLPTREALPHEALWERLQEPRQEGLVEPRLEAADAHPPAVLAGVDIVEGCTAVEGMLHTAGGELGRRGPGVGEGEDAWPGGWKAQSGGEREGREVACARDL